MKKGIMPLALLLGVLCLALLIFISYSYSVLLAPANTPPIINSLNPSFVTNNNPNPNHPSPDVVTILGSGFDSATEVLIETVPINSVPGFIVNFISPIQIDVTFPSFCDAVGCFVTNTGTTISVKDSFGQVSNSMELSVDAPTPAISSNSRGLFFSNMDDWTIVTGSGFQQQIPGVYSGTGVQFSYDGVNWFPADQLSGFIAFISENSVAVKISSNTFLSSITTAQNVYFRLTNPTSTGSTVASNTQTVTVAPGCVSPNVSPTITSVLVDGISTGSLTSTSFTNEIAHTISYIGTGFTSNYNIELGFGSVAVNYISSTRLDLYVPIYSPVDSVSPTLVDSQTGCFVAPHQINVMETTPVITSVNTPTGSYSFSATIPITSLPVAVNLIGSGFYVDNSVVGSSIPELYDVSSQQAVSIISFSTPSLITSNSLPLNFPANVGILDGDYSIRVTNPWSTSSNLVAFAVYTSPGSCPINGDTKSCYTGPAGTQNTLLCQAGTQTCNNHVWGTCNGQVLPTTETCNGLDDDCNGQIDNGITCSCVIGVVSSCFPGPGTQGVGICTAGTHTCNSQGNGYSACTGATTAIPEICNSLDDNCNGQTDEGCVVAPTPQPSSSGGGGGGGGGSPIARCGDSHKSTTEVCDDGNNVNGDGCSSTCRPENGFTCTTIQNVKSICTVSSLTSNSQTTSSSSASSNALTQALGGVNNQNPSGGATGSANANKDSAETGQHFNFVFLIVVLTLIIGIIITTWLLIKSMRKQNAFDELVKKSFTPEPSLKYPQSYPSQNINSGYSNSKPSY